MMEIGVVMFSLGNAESCHQNITLGQNNIIVGSPIWLKYKHMHCHYTTLIYTFK